MKDAITRRLAALEARRQHHHARRVLLMPWDLEPDAGPDDMVIRISFIRPTDRFGGEPVPYIRTGINPAEDDPNSHNGRLHRESAGDHPWTSRTYADVVETLPAVGDPKLGGRIPTALWRRIVAEGKLAQARPRSSNTA